MNTHPKSLRDLNKFLATFTKWVAVYDRHGYYYFVHPTNAPSNGVYVANCKHLSFENWKAEVKSVEEEFGQ